MKSIYICICVGTGGGGGAGGCATPPPHNFVGARIAFGPSPNNMSKLKNNCLSLRVK